MAVFQYEGMTLVAEAPHHIGVHHHHHAAGTAGRETS
jgi:hypothetical protein